MEIKINDKPADITLENEKTAGEVIEGLLKWLEGSGESGGQYISGIEINGKSYGSLTLDEAFKFPLDTISSMNIKTSSRVELMLEALLGLKNDFELYESQTEEEQKKFKLLWEDSAPALFLKEHDRDLFKTAANILAACESSPSGLLQIVLLIKERIREIEDPAREIKTLYPLLK